MRDFLLASRNVLRQQRRSAVALIAIAVGVAALIFAGGYIDWILRELRERTIRTQLGHIQVHVADRAGRASAEPPGPRRLPDDDAQARIAHYAHVVSVTPRLGLSGLVSRGDTTLAFVGEGLDPTHDVAARSLDDLVAGKPLDAGDPAGVLVGEGLAISLSAKPGDKAVLLLSLARGGVNASDVAVRGIFRTVSKSYDDVAVRMPLALAQRLLRTRAADVWIITLDRTESTAETLAALRADPSLRDLVFVPWTALADFYNKAAALYARQFRVMLVLIAIIIVLSITNTMTMNVTERTAEIGTMRAVGTPRRGVMRIFLFEGMVLGLIGGLAGIALGWVVNVLASWIGIPMPPPPGMRHAFVAGASFSLALAGPAFLLAVATTVVASVHPAIRASRLVIVDALRAAR